MDKLQEHSAFCLTYVTLSRFFGVDKFSVGGGAAETEYIVLEDLTERCERPSVMDIKIGSRTYGPDAAEKKRNHEVCVPLIYYSYCSGDSKT